jgi:hypothetical protein
MVPAATGVGVIPDDLPVGACGAAIEPEPAARGALFGGGSGHGIGSFLFAATKAANCCSKITIERETLRQPIFRRRTSDSTSSIETESAVATCSSERAMMLQADMTDRLWVRISRSGSRLGGRSAILAAVAGLW